MKTQGNTMTFTLDEYSKHFKMSKEMIHSKLKAKKLDTVIEDGVTYILVESDSLAGDLAKDLQQEQTVAQKYPLQSKELAKPKTTVATVLNLYQRENKHLKDKISQLELKIDKLVDDKEQMLRNEIDKLEQIYAAKDEQLKSILELINTKLMLENQPETIHEIESFVLEQKPKNELNNVRLVELRDYLRTLDLQSHQRKSIKKRFLEVYDSDVRIIQQNGKLYLDFSKYDYSDLLSY